MSKALTTCLLLALTGTLAAQTDDVITWHDGTKTKCEVVSFDAKHIQYKVKGQRQTAEAHKVMDVRIKKLVEDVYNRAVTPEDFLTAADEQFTAKKTLAGAWGYMKAAELFEAEGKFNSADTALGQLDTKVPNSPWTYRHFELRFRYFVGNKKRLREAMSVAEKYESAAIKRNWSRGFEHQAKFFMVVAEAASGKLTKEVIETKLKRVLGDTDGTAGFVFKEARVFLADFYRKNKEYAKAIKDYEAILDQPGVDPNVLSRAYLGLGYIHYDKGVANKDKEAFHQAYLAFLRVYVLARDADPELVAEALYNAAQAVESWGGLPTAKAEAARLRGRLRLRSPWKETSWAKKR
ncbi:MAG: tetratricopeptide repeat protein [Planctomycetota bacterium]|jgi:tetratricopeptide (TPR) repeat protein